MDRTPESCRQLASRARRKVRNAKQERRDEIATSGEVVQRFLTALATGDEAGAVACLAPDAVYLSDGGANQRAARLPVREPERIVRLLMSVWQRWPDDRKFDRALVGGFPGIVIEMDDRVFSATGVEVVDDKIVRITTMINPDKLAANLERRRDEVE
jgi:RNA polymerase sigma-70 factor (ECF subfamily)